MFGVLKLGVLPLKYWNSKRLNCRAIHFRFYCLTCFCGVKRFWPVYWNLSLHIILQKSWSWIYFQGEASHFWECFAWNSVSGTIVYPCSNNISEIYGGMIMKLAHSSNRCSGFTTLIFGSLAMSRSADQRHSLWGDSSGDHQPCSGKAELADQQTWVQSFRCATDALTDLSVSVYQSVWWE